MRISQNIKGLLVIVMGMAIAGCTVVVRNPEPIALGYHSQYDYYDDYYYYPSARVYFHIYTGYYYYWRGNRWVRSRVLPRYIRLHASDRHRLTIKDRYPYLRDYEYRKKYVPRGNFRFNERDDSRERNLNMRRFDEYRQRDDRRPEGRSEDRYRDDRMNDRREDNRSNRDYRPMYRERDTRDEKAQDHDRRRMDNKKHENNRKQENKSGKKSDSEDQNDNRKSNDNRKKDSKSYQFR